MRAAGLILAAGESRRMGRAKALLELDGRSFARLGVELLLAGGCAEVILVEGAHDLRARVGELPATARWVVNERWPLGPLSSIQAGLAALEAEVDALVVHHVERPRVRPETVRALLDGLARDPGTCWQPRVDGRSGHPLVWPAAAFGELATLDPRTDTARTLLRSPEWSPRRRKLDCDDLGALDNIDRPEDLAALKS